jgi:hypothetical protein
MSTLKESLQQRRAAELPESRSCDPVDVPNRGLLIETGTGETWVFPWSHFSAARHKTMDQEEQLVLCFVNYEVVLQGVRLAALLPEIAGYRVETLRSLPAKYEPQAPPATPFIKRLSISPVGEPPHTARADSG